MFAHYIAIFIFVTMFIFIVVDKIERHIVTLTAGALTILLVFLIGMGSFQPAWEVLNIRSIFTSHFWYAAGAESAVAIGVNWETIIFIAGMMIMVEGMAESGFFRWLCMRLAKAVGYNPLAIFITFMILSAVLAMFIDSITVVLFLVAITIEVAKLLKVNPVPFILAEIFCANLGGSATMCGDPPNIIIGTALGYSFGDFLSNTGLIALVGMVFAIAYFILVFGRAIKRESVSADQIETVNPKDVIKDKGKFIASSIIFAITVVLLVTHGSTGLTVATIGTIAAIITLLVYGKEIKIILRGVDYKTLLFFIGLFIAVGGLEVTGVLETIATFIKDISGGVPLLIVIIILWISAIASALVDNIPFAAVMIPVIRTLATTTGFDLDVFAWTLAMGTDLGGNATPIGASANVVGVALANKSGNPIGWGKYCKIMVPAAILTIAISMAMLYFRYF